MVWRVDLLGFTAVYVTPNHPYSPGSAAATAIMAWISSTVIRVHPWSRFSVAAALEFDHMKEHIIAPDELQHEVGSAGKSTAEADVGEIDRLLQPLPGITTRHLECVPTGASGA